MARRAAAVHGVGDGGGRIEAIRDAAAADEPAIAAMHLASWRETYRGLLPDEYLDDVAPRVVRERWARIFAGRGHITQDGGDVLLVAEIAGGVAGFAYAFPDPARPARVEIDNLHVAAGQRSRGIGARLMRAVAARCVELGRDEAILYVVEGNDAAARFYARLGGQALPPQPHDMPGHGPVDNTPFLWMDLRPLARAGAGA